MSERFHRSIIHSVMGPTDSSDVILAVQNNVTVTLFLFSLTIRPYDQILVYV